MVIKNSTHYSVNTALIESVASFPTEELVVEVKYCPQGSRRYISGTYYRWMRNREEGKLIRLRINKNNRYPIEVPFKTSEYTRKINGRGETLIYQKTRREKFHTPEDLILGIFLHEFSHYLDHIEGRNGRYKQTKADKFAVDILEELEIIPRRLSDASPNSR